MDKKEEFIDHYAVVGVEIGASESEINRAYRQMALKLHPDKNQDDPNAVKNFQLLQTSYSILTDEKAKKAFDALYKAKIEAQKRLAKLNEKHLIMREKMHQQKSENDLYNDLMNDYQKEVERLRKQSAILVEREIEKKKAQSVSNQSASKTRLKVTWKCSCHPCILTQDVLKRMFEKYGEIQNIVLSLKSKKLAIIEFKDDKSRNAIACEKGLSTHKFLLTLIQSPEQEEQKPIKKERDTLDDLEERIFSKI
ncbi:DnaJ subfamily C member 17 [Thelohanellus kitauei]|uniref:DnaJ subfamily C member 17 n=1 Tax=Thelohanellus kitauei TaxID=669202 RepID=A0A0C2IVA8_THEKT|nr:DnaJ subfamily C member 17 [Thelohanellus kitauei]